MKFFDGFLIAISDDNGQKDVFVIFPFSGDDEITKEHLEKVLPQLLLDFGP